MSEKQSTKKCPVCECKDLILLTTYNEKICPDCRIFIPWYLDDGQKPLFSGKRDD